MCWLGDLGYSIGTWTSVRYSSGDCLFQGTLRFCTSFPLIAQSWFTTAKLQPALRYESIPRWLIIVNCMLFVLCTNTQYSILSIIKQISLKFCNFAYNMKTNMTKEELLQRLNDIEWDDFEVKEASGGLPKSIWETVSAFSNTSSGWIILGVKENRDESGTTYIVTGVPNAEKMEQEIISTLRSRTKFNALISGKAKQYDIDGKKVLAFEIPLSPHRPVALKGNGDVYIRTGSGDVLASDLEIDAIIRDSAFGSKSEMEVPNSGFDDINRESIASYRSYLRDYNRALSYPGLDDKEFCSN